MLLPQTAHMKKSDGFETFSLIFAAFGGFSGLGSVFWMNLNEFSVSGLIGSFIPFQALWPNGSRMTDKGDSAAWISADLADSIGESRGL